MYKSIIAKFFICVAIPLFSYEVAAGVKRVLSLDPGVLHGYPQIVVLAEIEKRTGQPIAELFDLIGGTSTGALISSLLTRPQDAALDEHDSRPMYSAEQIGEFYESYSKDIFSNKSMTFADAFGIEEWMRNRERFLDGFLLMVLRMCAECADGLASPDLGGMKKAFQENKVEGLARAITQWLSTGTMRQGGNAEDIGKELARKLANAVLRTEVAGSYFNADAFRAALLERLGDVAISQTIKPIALFSIGFRTDFRNIMLSNFNLSPVDLKRAKYRVTFSTDDGKEGAQKNISLRDAVYASSAGDTLFPPAQFEYEGITQSFIDGDSPDFSTQKALLAIARAKWPNDRIEVYSLGYKTLQFKREQRSAHNGEITFDEKRVKAVDNGHIIYNLRPIQFKDEIANRAGADDGNFDLMRRHAMDFINGKFFDYAITKLTASH